MNTMKKLGNKRLPTCVLTLAMLLCLLLVGAAATAASEGEVTLYFRNEKLRTAPTDTGAEYTGNTGKWSASGTTLTLNGFSFETDAATALILPGGTTLKVEGNSSIKSNNSGASHQGAESYGINGAGSLVIDVDNGVTLTVNGGPSAANSSYGICCKKLEVDCAGTINATAGNAHSRSCGIFIQEEGGSIKNGTINATAGTAAMHQSCGMLLGSSGTHFDIEGGAVTATGGACTGATSNFNNSSGIYLYGYLNIKGGSVTAEGGTSTNKSYGIDNTASAHLTISGGTVEAKCAADRTQALGQAPILINVNAFGSTNTSVEPTTAYDKDANNTYKRFKSTEININNTMVVSHNNGSSYLYYENRADGWKEAVGDANTGSTIVYLLDDWTAVGGSFGTDAPYFYNGEIQVPAGKTVTLDLNGYNIDRNLTASTALDDGAVFLVNGGMTIKNSSANGSITGGNNKGNGGGIILNGTLSMTGGKITGNSAALGGGVYDFGTLNVSGDAVITGNTNSNVYLESSHHIVINAPLTPSVQKTIGVTTVTPPTSEQPVPITTHCDADYSSWFSSDNPLYYVRKSEGTNNVLELALNPPVPDREYTITFDANGGALSQVSATTVNGKLVSLPTPVKSGFGFGGWYASASGGAQVTTDTVFTANATIYARWTQGGSGGGSSSGVDALGGTIKGFDSTVTLIFKSGKKLAGAVVEINGVSYTLDESGVLKNVPCNSGVTFRVLANGKYYRVRAMGGEYIIDLDKASDVATLKK